MSAPPLVITGSMTMASARGLLAHGLEALAAAQPVIDLSGVDEADSAGLAVLFGWQRAAAAQGKSLRVVNLPASVVSLAEVYGVTDLLPRP